MPNWMFLEIYEALCFDVAQARMNGTPSETRTHSWKLASLAYLILHYPRCPYWMLVCLSMCYGSHVRIFAFILTCILTYIHIFPRSVVEKEWDEVRACQNGRVDEAGWEMDCYNQNDFFALNLIITKGLFDVNMTFVEWWWIKLNSSSRNFF